MARAKRTARADARRRHRAQVGDALPVTGGPEPEGATTEPAPPTGGPAIRRTVPGPGSRDRGERLTQERPAPAGGIRNAFRLAFRPLTLREDIALLPRLLRNRAFWLPCLLAAVTVAAVVAFQGRELVSQFLLTYFVYPPPIGGLFLAGFLAPRASYLLGALVGIVTSVLLAVVVAAAPALFQGATPSQALVAGLVTSPLAGIFFASAAAWYRRFLHLASPARQVAARRPPPPRGRPARGR